METERTCPFCKYTFSTKGNMMNHIRKYCGKDKKEFQVHFICGGCEKDFFSNYSLQRHQKTSDKCIMRMEVQRLRMENEILRTTLEEEYVIIEDERRKQRKSKSLNIDKLPLKKLEFDHIIPPKT